MIFKDLTLTNGFGHIFMLPLFLHDRHGLPPSLNFMLFQFMLIFPMFFQCFHVNTVGWQFWSFVKFTRRHRPHDALQCAHVPNLSVCVTFGAPRFGTQNRFFCEFSKYVLFSITFCAHALQTTVSVTFWATCSCASHVFLGHHLATWARMAAALVASWPPWLPHPAPNFAPGPLCSDSSRQGRHGTFRRCALLALPVW